MTIEVREIVIQASVTRRPGDAEAPPDETRPYEVLKAELLEECRRLVADILRQERER